MTSNNANSISNRALLKIAASSLIMAVTMAGCTSGASMTAHPGATTSGQADKQLASLVARAEAALAKRDAATALTHAETLVAAQPQNAGYRVLLGRAYLADGRFVSAETAFTDAMTLGDTGARTIVSLSLAKVALGKSEDARALLVTHMDGVPATDYGLAMAMAGDPQEAIRILSAAAQAPDASAKTRQNLAYAYALAGQWRESRLMASQDLAPLAATQRIVGWAQTAEPGAETARVAAFIGTQLRTDDAGMPVRLALAAPTTPDAPAQVAQADMPAAVTAPEATPVADTAAPVAVAQSEPVTTEAPVIRAPATPVRSAAIGTTPIAAATTMMRKVALMLPAPSSSTAYVVQLGAYDSAAVARERWQRMARSNAHLGKFPVSYTTANVQGRLYHRLAVGGFGARASAYQMCRVIRSQGGACFIRVTTPDQKWAKVATKKKQQFAAR